MSEAKKQVSKQKRTVYRVHLDKLIKYAARMSTGGLLQGHGNAIQMLRDCVYAQKGLEKRELDMSEAAGLLRKGFE